MNKPLTQLDLWRRALKRSSGREAWQGVQDLAETLEPQLEMPPGASDGEFPDGVDGRPSVSRRDLFRLLGASAALAGVTGCPSRPKEEIVPYRDRQPEQVPGRATAYATSMILDGFATGLLGQTHGGRPVKIEGNPDHPTSLGASGVYHQASILGLYDPARARHLLRRGRPARWMEAQDALKNLGPRPWFVLHPQSSPVVAALIDAIRERRPGARFCFHSPAGRSEVYRAADAVYGRPLETHYDFRRARRILSLDADFTAAMPASLRWAREYAEGHRLSSPQDDPGRLYVVEPSPTPTGSLADHRLAVPGTEVAAIAAGVLLGVARATGATLPAPVAALAETIAGESHRRWTDAVARDLVSQRGRSVVIAGDRQPPETHALAHALNSVLDNLGETVTLREPALFEPVGGESLASLADALRADEVDNLVILGANPVYTAPVDLRLGELLPRARQTMHLSLFFNETSESCDWFVPAAHYLESWGVARAYDGTLSLMQPLIRPLYDNRTATEVLATCAGIESSDETLIQDAVFRATGLAAARGDQGELPDPALLSWRRYLEKGLVPDSDFPVVNAAPRWTGVAELLGPRAKKPRARGLELNLEIDHKVYDGRFAANGWLQELPHPMTKLTWDNAALLSPKTARELGVERQSQVRLQVGQQSLLAPVVVLPGHADEAVTLALGYGRGGEEPLAAGVGVNAFELRTSDHRFFAPGLRVEPTGQTPPLAFTQDHWDMHDREIALHSDLEHYRENTDFTVAHRGELPSWLPPQVFDYSKGEQWAMTIDTSICTGCSACVIACQAENNIPIVGKEGVAQSREMHWLRIDRYFAGPADDPTIINQPMMCQHCEKAPCEYVCPVFATTHSPDGLNEMTYNRCVGTRFCSNNCPYKVRRFNWFEYNGERSTADLQRNPSVTVRARGVMEKCTYCVQRIRRAGIDARIEERGIRPGEVETACMQACPTDAIQFGSLDQQDTKMVKWRQQPRRYEVLHELGTRPRTMYLARIKNLNPELPES